ncbi:hypothetical protein [Crassaminicella indica]|uniref:Bacterial PH domain-containing protein n=1 Tax=Crassaminicella indica TaxID=2855394 RepID=A0ABX8R8R5_9CLOT|nr:hypothetical protein [Crassaminicella indica]QXM05430.1 hypothetical protein KVH43_08525 [Crassaminicella indica]
MIKTYTHNRISSVYQYMIMGIGIILILYSIYDQHYYKIFLGLLLIYASFFEKNVFIAEEGVLIQTKKIRSKKERMIKFAQMQRISIQKRNDKAMLFCEMGNVGYKVIVDATNVDKIIGLAKKHNKKIDIYYVE